MKPIFFLVFLLCSCNNPDLKLDDNPENQVKELENRFEGEEYYYVSYVDSDQDLILKSKKMSYDNANSYFDLTDLFSKIKSKEDYIYLLSRKGIYNINAKSFVFKDNVKIVIEKKYLLEGNTFNWNGETKTLDAPPTELITIKDTDGMKLTGINFNSKIEENTFNLTNVTITIPDNVAKNEGID